MEYAVATDADLPAMDDGVDAFGSAMSSLKTVTLQILHDLETDEDVFPHATQQCGFGACVLNNQHNLHRAPCGFGAKHGRRPSFCECEFACGFAAI